MDSSTHKVLCCVGAAIGGQPTQFVMEKAIAAAQLDWRVITVEVLPQDLEAALAGMRAMGFAAIRFFPPYDSQCAELMCGENSISKFVGGVTSARNQNGKWTCWHNVGYAILERTAAIAELSKTTLWINGDSLEMRSLMAACVESPPQRIFWVCAPQEIPEPIGSLSGLRRVPANESDELFSQLAEEIARQVEPFRFILAGERVLSQAESLLALDGVNEGNLVVYETSKSVKNSGPTHDWGGKLTMIEPASVEMAAELVDCQRWTGVPPNRAVIEDAYEEYVDF